MSETSNHTTRAGRSFVRINILLLLILVLPLSSCIDPINLNVHYQGNQLVVRGMITNSTGPQKLLLGMTSRYEQQTKPVTQARVIIYDDAGNQEAYQETEPGTYILAGNTVKGIPGRTYHLVINLTNGKEYQTNPETMPLIIATDSAYYQFGKEKQVSGSGITLEKHNVEAIVDTHIPPSQTPLYLKWNVFEIYKFTQFYYPNPFNTPPPDCYVTIYSNPQNFTLYNGEELNANEITHEKLATKIIDETFYQKHKFYVKLSSITRNAYEYWNKVSEVVNRSGTIFDVPPATVRGNVYNVDSPDETVLGYFEAARVDTSTFSIYPYQLPVPVNDPCRTTVDPACRACTTLPNSTMEVPYNY